jgi:hypothetical protein
MALERDVIEPIGIFRFVPIYRVQGFVPAAAHSEIRR